jgi:hypothetical protein
LQNTFSSSKVSRFHSFGLKRTPITVLQGHYMGFTRQYKEIKTTRGMKGIKVTMTTPPSSFSFAEEFVMWQFKSTLLKFFRACPCR